MCIVGENGSGKSTLVKGILGLKSPVSGTITRGDGLLPSEIGYLPQQTQVQRDFPASVYEVVLSGRLNSLRGKPFYSQEDKNSVSENMELMGITEFSKRCYHELSGGQQQRVLLARALCATKKMILLDEPVAGLDPIVTAEMYSLIAAVNRDKNITVIMVSHDIGAAIKYSGLILHLGHRQLFFGSTEEYAASELGKRFIGGETDA